MTAVRFSPFDTDRRGHMLQTELQVAESPPEVFAFFADAFQLESITPPWLHFSVQSERPIDMHAGTLIDYRLRLRGLPLCWRSLISVWDPHVRFVDEQVRGPYRYWRHEHTFESTDGGTIVRDNVRYGIPFGRILHPLVKHDLRRIFEYRHLQLSKFFTLVNSGVELPYELPQ